MKDILALERIKAPRPMLELLKLVAFQVGSEVSLNELASQVGLDAKTVTRYLDILEKGFVLERVGGFSRNLRNQVTSKAKYYFLDNGILNAVISQYNLLVQSADNSRLEESACLVVKNIGKPDAGKLHVRFDEGGRVNCSLIYPNAYIGDMAK